MCGSSKLVLGSSTRQYKISGDEFMFIGCMDLYSLFFAGMSRLMTKRSENRTTASHSSRFSCRRSLRGF